MKDLTEASDEALAAEIERRRRRREDQEADNREVLRKWLHNSFAFKTDPLNAAIMQSLRNTSEDKLQTFWVNPDRFDVEICLIGPLDR